MKCNLVLKVPINLFIKFNCLCLKIRFRKWQMYCKKETCVHCQLWHFFFLFRSFFFFAWRFTTLFKYFFFSIGVDLPKKHLNFLERDLKCKVLSTLIFKNLYLNLKNYGLMFYFLELLLKWIVSWNFYEVYIT